MAAANESQGLKIAVAVFVTLTVVLAVTTYFAYSSYDQALAQRNAARADAARASAQLARYEIRDDTVLTRTWLISGYQPGFSPPVL